MDTLRRPCASTIILAVEALRRIALSGSSPARRFQISSRCKPPVRTWQYDHKTGSASDLGCTRVETN